MSRDTRRGAAKSRAGGQPGSGAPPAGGRSPFVEQVADGLAAALAAAPATGAEAPSGGKAVVRLMVAFSGGPDSTALLGALLALRRGDGARSYEICACHVNHHLRGEESDRDERFCQDLAARWSVPLVVQHMGMGLAGAAFSEAEARDRRYALLSAAARELGAAFVLAAHTLDDQAETLLFRLLRGTGPTGLVGMAPCRRLSDGTALIRPLLAITRAECLAFLEELQQVAVHDSSNDNPDYARNYIRARLIPSIRERFPGFEGRLNQLRQLVAADEALLAGLTGAALAELASGPGCDAERWDLRRFLSLPEAIRGRVLARSLEARAVAVTFERVQRLLDICNEPRGGALSLNGVWDLRVEGGSILWIDKSVPPDSPPALEVQVRIPGTTPVLGVGRALRVKRWETAENSAPPPFPDQRSLEAVVDLSAASLPLVVRNRRPGDRFRPFGTGRQVKLKKFLHNHKVKGCSEDEFARAVVLADQEEVLWVPGVALSDKLRVTGRPTHGLAWLALAGDDAQLC